MVRSQSAVVALAVLALSSGAEAQRKRAASPPPIITVAPSPAPTETYGDWIVRRLTATAFFASTANDGGAVLGSICNAGGCTAFLNPKISCEPDHDYPALVNAPGGSFSTQLHCEKIEDLLLYSFSVEGDMVDAMSIGGVLGVAFPMASGEFKVSRFSLTGAARATARAQQLAHGIAPTSRPSGSDHPHRGITPQRMMRWRTGFL
jgi:hypothetical protein